MHASLIGDSIARTIVTSYLRTYILFTYSNTKGDFRIKESNSNAKIPIRIKESGHRRCMLTYFLIKGDNYTLDSLELSFIFGFESYICAHDRN